MARILWQATQAHRERAAARKAAVKDFMRRRRVVEDGVSGYNMGGA